MLCCVQSPRADNPGDSLDGGDAARDLVARRTPPSERTFPRGYRAPPMPSPLDGVRRDAVADEPDDAADSSSASDGEDPLTREKRRLLRRLRGDRPVDSADVVFEPEPEPEPERRRSVGSADAAEPARRSHLNDLDHLGLGILPGSTPKHRRGASEPATFARGGDAGRFRRHRVDGSGTRRGERRLATADPDRIRREREGERGDARGIAFASDGDELASGLFRGFARGDGDGDGKGAGAREQPLDGTTAAPGLGPGADDGGKSRRARVKSMSVTSLADEDCCPTCFEEYDAENPKMPLACGHHFHLGCIYEWYERSELCPVCEEKMEFDPSTGWSLEG
jgi:hypothetical protein